MRASRVLLLNNFAPPLGGAEEHVATLRGLLEARGVQVELLAPEPRGGLGDLVDRVHNRAFAARVRAVIEARRPDIVHVHNFLRRVSTAPLAVARAMGVASVLTVHDFQLVCPRTWAVRADGLPCPEPALARCLFGGCRGSLTGLGGRTTYALNALRRPWIARRVARLVTTVTAPALALRDRLTAVLGREVLHLPYPFEPAAAAVAPPTKRLLFVGRVAKEKGLDGLLTALRQVEGLELTIAGDGPQLTMLRARVEDERLGARVQFLGSLPHEQIRARMLEHGAVAVPSLWMDNSPLVVHEALAAGRPVLGARRGGIPELVADGEQGLLFEPTDIEQIRAGLVRYRDLTVEEHAAMAERARQRAAQGSPERFGERLAAVYDLAMRTGGTP